MVTKPSVEPVLRCLPGPRRGAVARGLRRPALHPLVAAMAACSSWSIMLPAAAQLPTGPTVVSGSAGVATVGNRMTVTNSPNAIVDWQSFSIGATNGVHFQQADAASQILNRVTGSDASQILGSLSSNGKVWLINPHGVLFGQNARIDVAGLVASTLAVSNADFLAGRLGFAAAGSIGPATVTNRGEIRTTFGGHVWLLGDQVRNEGLIQAPGGDVVLAAGRSVELIDSGLPNVVVRLVAPAGEAINLGTLAADGGHVDVHGGIVNQDGIVRADRIDAGRAGSIVLRAATDVTLGRDGTTQAAGGTVRVEAGGTLNHRGRIGGADVTLAANQLLQQGRITAPGGSVAMTAAAVTYLDGAVDVSDPPATGGSIRLATGKLEGMAGGSLRADGRHGGDIRVTGHGMVAFSSTLSAAGREVGGSVEVSGDSVYLLSADVDASGGARGGTVHLGGGWQGGGDLPHAREVFVGVGSKVRADAEAGGKGGEIAVWSTRSSEHYGMLQARGGGRIELSSQGEIRQTGVLEAGAGGSVLLDPKNLVVTDNPPDSVALALKVTSGSVGSAQPALADGDFLGAAVSIDGDRLAVGAPGDNTGGFQAGAVHLFTGVGNGSGLTWRKKLASGTGAFDMPALHANDYFGTAVALDGDRLIVGAPFDDGGSSSASADYGAVYGFLGVGTDFSALTIRGRLGFGSSQGVVPILAPGDAFGYSVALKGDRAAIGAPGDDTGGPGRGAVYLFSGASGDFSALAPRNKLASSVGARGMPALPDLGQFGYSVAFDADRLVVGAPQDGTGGVNTGAVHLFTGGKDDFSGLVWSGKIAAGSTPAGMGKLLPGDLFGSSVALADDRLVIGARGDDSGGPERGAVYLLTGVGSDFSTLVAGPKLASASGAAGMPALNDGDMFGWSVSLGGDWLVVGARQDSTGGTSRGAVHLFNGAAAPVFPKLAWQSKLASGTGVRNMPALAAGDSFGNAVALDGDRLAVGAPYDDTGGADRGAVHLFTGVGTGFAGLTWQKKLSSGTGAANMPALRDSDLFGAALALDGDRLAVGALYDDNGSEDRNANFGAVHLFTGVGTDFSGLTRQKTLVSGSGAIGMPALAPGDQFGSAVALKGDLLAVGAFADNSGGLNQGAVHLFTGVGTDFSSLGWQKKLASGSGAFGMPTLTGNDLFGSAVALDGDRLAVGAPSDPAGAGAVHLFTGVGTDFSGLTWQKKLASGSGAVGMPALAKGDQFGSAVALSGDRLAVGAPQDDTGGTDRGAVYLFAGVGTSFSGLSWRGKISSGTGATGMATLADNDQFGISVSLNGDRLAVGARYDGGIGAVYLFNGVSTSGSGAVGVGDATFAADAAGTSFITPSTIRSLLDAGTAVTLQANNDITVQSAIRANNASGNGGNLVLQAGRSISFLAGVTTDNGSLTAVAGDAAANPAFRDAGTPSLAIASGVTLDVGTGTATLAAVGGNVVNNAGDSAVATTGAGRWLIYSTDPASTTEGFSSFNKHYDQPFTPGSTPSYAGSGNWFLYGIAPTLSVAPGSQSVVYGNGTPDFLPSYRGFIDGDTAATAGLGGTPAWTVGGTRSSSGAPTAGSHELSYAGGLASGLGYRLADDAASRNELSVAARPLTASYAGSSKVYDGTPAAIVTGSSADIMAGDAVSFSQTAAFRNRNAGSGKAVDVGNIALGGADAGNYALQNATAATTADIARKPLTLELVGTVSKIYDGTTTAALAPGNVSLAGVVPGDAVGANVSGTAYDSRNAGVGKAVSVAAAGLTGADAGNYSLERPAPSNIGTITPAPLTYVADAKTGAVGAPLPELTGKVTGFVDADTLANSTSGSLAWKTPATTASSPAGTYPIDGVGLSAANYTFQQATGNATALTLVAANNPELPPKRIAASTTQAVDVAVRAAMPVLDWGGRGLSDRATMMMSPLASSFEAVNLALMTREEIQQLLDARKEFMRKLLFNAIFKLEQDPSLADVRPCPSLADVDSGLCMMTPDQRRQLGLKAEAHRNKPKVKVATLPQIERKVVVLFGINRYADPTIPPLESAVPDAEAVGRLFADKLGYEARVVKNPTKADIFRTLNQLAAEVDVNDSVIVYYAGHGYLDEKTGAGYWVPSDGSPDDPARWISNADISKMLSEITARQVAMISDSCYSGAFTKEEKVASSAGNVTPSEVLTKRSVVVMSSGGDEPVADTGKAGHSIFAWQLMQALRDVEKWQPGTTIFEQVQREVSRTFPQTPQYGAAASAGHQAGGEYLFEVRQLEETTRN